MHINLFKLLKLVNIFRMCLTLIIFPIVKVTNIYCLVVSALT